MSPRVRVPKRVNELFLNTAIYIFLIYSHTYPELCDELSWCLSENKKSSLYSNKSSSANFTDLSNGLEPLVSLKKKHTH